MNWIVRDWLFITQRLSREENLPLTRKIQPPAMEAIVDAASLSSTLVVMLRDNGRKKIPKFLSAKKR
jgi:hypothetical protein